MEGCSKVWKDPGADVDLCLFQSVNNQLFCAKNSHFHHSAEAWTVDSVLFILQAALCFCWDASVSHGWIACQAPAPPPSRPCTQNFMMTGSCLLGSYRSVTNHLMFNLSFTGGCRGCCEAARRCWCQEQGGISCTTMHMAEVAEVGFLGPYGRSSWGQFFTTGLQFIQPKCSVQAGWQHLKGGMLLSGHPLTLWKEASGERALFLFTFFGLGSPVCFVHFYFHLTTTKPISLCNHVCNQCAHPSEWSTTLRP